MKIYPIESLFKLGVINGTTTRELGDMRPYDNRNKFYESLAVPSARMLSFKQTHGTEILEVNSEEDFTKIKEAENSRQEIEADGWILRHRGCGISIITADCVPLFLWDETGNTLGLAHAGWRGVAGGLPQKTALQMKESGAKNIFAATGPHIKRCCFEIQPDILNQFSEEALIKKENKIFVDLALEVEKQLLKAGVKKENMNITGCECKCTCCNPEYFFSYRRDKTKETLLSFMFKV